VLPLDDFLETPKKKDSEEFKEADIEGAARIGDRIYWIGSHGRDSRGGAEPARACFFATSIVPHRDGPRLEVAGSRAFKGLRDALLADGNLAHLGLVDAYAPDKKKGPPPESEAGFNIEGLAATGDGGLLIGFRNPRPEGQAIVIPMNNPSDVVESSQPVFGRAMLLELEGRGIRSIDRVGTRYFIVAGPHGPASKSEIKPPFALFVWDGPEAGTKPTKVESVAIPGDFSPEAMFASPDGSTLTLVSDDGDLDACKKAPEGQRKFRTLTVRVPG
jgi:hypothetical protein